MPKIVTKSLTDTLRGLPDVVMLDVGSFRDRAPDDLFLCALGFEPRCLVLPRRLRAVRYRARQAFYFTYETNVEDNDANLATLRAQLRGIAPTVHAINCDSEDFASQFRNVMGMLFNEAKREIPTVTLDISVTANRLLLTCIKILLEYDCRVRIVYSEANLYHPTREEYEKDAERWLGDDGTGLERGVDKVIFSVVHPGHALDPLPDCVFLFPSFKQERSRAVISAVDPALLSNPADRVLWLLGIPRLPENQWRLEAMKAINGIKGSMPQVKVSTFDYKDPLGVLDRLYWERADSHNISLSPLGSKMQALGTALFCHMHPDVRVILSTPMDYNANQYSDGCKDVWCVEFGSLVEIRRKLEEVGTLVVDD